MICIRFAFRKKKPLVIVSEGEMESVFALHANVTSPVISLGPLPLRSMLPFVIEKGRKAALCWMNNLD